MYEYVDVETILRKSIIIAFNLLYLYICINIVKAKIRRWENKNQKQNWKKLEN